MGTVTSNRRPEHSFKLSMSPQRDTCCIQCLVVVQQLRVLLSWFWGTWVWFLLSSLLRNSGQDKLLWYSKLACICMYRVSFHSEKGKCNMSTHCLLTTITNQEKMNQMIDRLSSACSAPGRSGKNAITESSARRPTQLLLSST